MLVEQYQAASHKGRSYNGCAAAVKNMKGWRKQDHLKGQTSARRSICSGAQMRIRMPPQNLKKDWETKKIKNYALKLHLQLRRIGELRINFDRLGLFNFFRNLETLELSLSACSNTKPNIMPVLLFLARRRC